MKGALPLTAALLLFLAPVAEAKRQALKQTNDWRQAVRIVQAAYPGSSTWLLSCSGSEGGHGAWQWRSPNGFLRFTTAGAPIWVADIPGGPMQYFQRTFWGDFHAALADLRAHGFKAPASAASWYSMLGQAIAAGWAWAHDRPAGKWTGGGC